MRRTHETCAEHENCVRVTAKDSVEHIHAPKMPVNPVKARQERAVVASEEPTESTEPPWLRAAAYCGVAALVMQLVEWFA